MEIISSISAKYVRKPLYVDAVQVTEDNFEEVVRWCAGAGEVRNEDGTPVDKIDPSKQYIHVRVHNPRDPRQTQAHVGDWILYTALGFKVYTTKAFQMNFDKVVEEDSAANVNTDGVFEGDLENV